MLRIIKFVFVILLINNVFSQNKEKVYVILDNESLYKITKKEKSATIEIPYYNFKNDWNKEKSNSIKDKDYIVNVEVIPNKKHYTFYSIKEPIKKSNVNKINAFSVVDVSKDDKKVWKKYPYEMIFIEKINCESYIFWYMKPEFHE